MLCLLYLKLSTTEMKTMDIFVKAVKDLMFCTCFNCPCLLENVCEALLIKSKFFHLNSCKKKVLVFIQEPLTGHKLF